MEDIKRIDDLYRYVRTLEEENSIRLQAVNDMAKDMKGENESKKNQEDIDAIANGYLFRAKQYVYTQKVLNTNK